MTEEEALNLLLLRKMHMNLLQCFVHWPEDENSMGKHFFLEHTEWEYLLLKCGDLFRS